jgi:hypothetical protein
MDMSSTMSSTVTSLNGLLENETMNSQRYCPMTFALVSALLNRSAVEGRGVGPSIFACDRISDCTAILGSLSSLLMQPQ